MSIKSVIKKQVVKIAPTIFNANDISLSPDSFLHENTTLKGAKMRGTISIGEGCKIIGGVRLSGRAPIEIDNFTSINGPATELFAAINKIKIGKFCSIARQVSIQEYNHIHERISSYFVFRNVFKEDMEQDIKSKGGISIGNDVWIGSNVSILSGVQIGHGAVVAANSVVTKDIPNYAIVGGIPAKFIKKRFEQPIIDRLLQIKWWNWNLEKIKEHRSLFEKSLTLDMLEKF